MFSFALSKVSNPVFKSSLSACLCEEDQCLETFDTLISCEEMVVSGILIHIFLRIFIS